MVLCKYLFDGCFLVLDIDRACGDAVDDDSVGWHDKFCVFSQATDPSFVLFESCGLCYRRGKDLYVAALELMGCDYLN